MGIFPRMLNFGSLLTFIFKMCWVQQDCLLWLPVPISLCFVLKLWWRYGYYLSLAVLCMSWTRSTERKVHAHKAEDNTWTQEQDWEGNHCGAALKGTSGFNYIRWLLLLNSLKYTAISLKASSGMANKNLCVSKWASQGVFLQDWAQWDLLE